MWQPWSLMNWKTKLLKHKRRNALYKTYRRSLFYFFNEISPVTNFVLLIFFSTSKSASPVIKKSELLSMARFNKK